MNRIVISPYWSRFGAGLPDGFDRVRTLTLWSRRTNNCEIDTRGDFFVGRAKSLRFRGCRKVPQDLLGLSERQIANATAMAAARKFRVPANTSAHTGPYAQQKATSAS